jgi:hypothetical protein
MKTVKSMAKKMKPNRPTEPGIYWYRNNYDGSIDGTLVGRPYGRRSGPLKVFHVEDDRWSEIGHFEDCEVAEWLGQAHPPKKVKVNVADFVVDGSVNPEGLSYETEQMRVVMFEDVKEFLIGE